jgi:LysM repeat protein
MIKRTGIFLAFALMISSALSAGNWQVAAQSELLQNGYFTSYYGIGGSNVVPTGWKLTSSIPVSSTEHAYRDDGPVEFPGQPKDGHAWELHATSSLFTAIAYQQVAGVAAGTKLHFTVWGNVYTCNKTNSCIENNIPYRISDKASGARERIGIDPNGGIDPNAASVVWSSFISPFDVYQQFGIDATAASSNGVTVYLYATQSVGLLLNYAYWYGASLQTGGSGGVSGTPAAQYAPSVKTQAPQRDGSIVHVVGAGDTLSTIAVAYNVPVDQIRKLNNLSVDSKYLQIGQKLIIKNASGDTGTGVATAVPTTLTGASAIDDTTALNAQSLAPSPTTPSGTTICAVVFLDTNQNRIVDDGENKLSDVPVMLNANDADAQSLNTDVNGTACFAIANAGSYTVSVAPNGYVSTTAAQIEVEARVGTMLQVSFGVVPAETRAPTVVAMLTTPAPAGSPADSVATTSRLSIILLGIGAVVSVMLCISGIAGLYWLFRKKS